jgi:hypothetical protein
MDIHLRDPYNRSMQVTTHANRRADETLVELLQQDSESGAPSPMLATCA